MHGFLPHLVRAAVVAAALWSSACSNDVNEIPELDRDRLVALEGPVPVRDLLDTPGDHVLCLLRPYDDSFFLELEPRSLPEGFSVSTLEPLLPVYDDEFVLAIVGPEHTLSNRYQRASELDLLPAAQSAREEPRTVCASTSTAIILIQRRAGQALITLTEEP